MALSLLGVRRHAGVGSQCLLKGEWVLGQTVDGRPGKPIQKTKMVSSGGADNTIAIALREELVETQPLVCLTSLTPMRRSHQHASGLLLVPELGQVRSRWRLRSLH